LNAIDTGVYTAMHGNSSLLNATTGGIYNVKAPEGTSLPYITFFDVITTRGRTFGPTALDDGLYQVDIWAASNTAAGVILDLLLTALDGATLTITGYSSVMCLLQNLQKMSDPDSDVSRIMCEFRVMTQK